MNFTLVHRVTAFVVFMISTVVFLMTVAPTLSFWDCGEFIASAVTMGVPHPPGAPFFQLVGRIFSLIPFSEDLGLRVNLVSVFSSSLTVLFTFLVTVRLLRMWHGEPKTMMGAVAMLGAAAAGALTLSFSDTFWFSASEAEVYGIGMFFISVTVWIALEWYAHAGVFDSERTLLLIAYLMGLSIGVHLLSLLALFFVAFLVFFRDRPSAEMTSRHWLIFLALTFAGFAVIYPGVVKYIPTLLSSSTGIVVLVALVAGAMWLVTAKKVHVQLRMAALGALLVVLGFSTYSLIVIRAGQQPALNENDPSTLPKLYSYLNRDQYGTYPLLRGPNFDPATGGFTDNKLFPRRWNPENVPSYGKYSSDLEYFMSFQLGHIYIRYFLWNFVGRAGDLQDAPVVLASSEGDWSESPGYPNRYYAIPLLLGLLGLYYHFRKDWKTGTATAALFFMTGIGLVIYFNMAEPQVRERDYFFVGSFYVFAIWVGLGVYGLIEALQARMGGKQALGVAIAGLALVAAPGNMLYQNYQTHDRHYNYVAFDYAYNMLQSCDQDGILFTGGDNDTFPLWYLQFVAGVRRDVRVVNLSLVNTDWYSKQLKNEEPYGAKKVAISYTDAELEMMRPSQWAEQPVRIPINPAAFDVSSLRDVPFVKQQAGIPDAIEFSVRPTFTDPNGNQGLRNQDMMVLNIITENINTRPIYFALSVGPNDKVGIDEHLIVEGLVQRVTPFKFPQRGDRYYPAVNVGVTRRHLMETRETPDSTRAFGFMFRELANPKINLDEASTKMLLSFRYLYMATSQVAFQDFGDSELAKQLLRKMNAVMPQQYHEMDMTMKTDLSTMYFMFNDTASLREIAPELEKYYKDQLAVDITGRSTPRSPYSALLNIYEALGEYQKGVDLLNNYLQVNPQDESARRQMESWKEAQQRGSMTPPAGDTAAAPAEGGN